MKKEDNSKINLIKPKNREERVMLLLILAVVLLIAIVMITGYNKPNQKDEKKDEKSFVISDVVYPEEEMNSGNAKTSTEEVKKSETTTELTTTEEATTEEKTTETPKVADYEPPVIEGLKDKEVLLNESISYREGVTLSDNIDAPEDIKLEINNSEVRLDEEGTYRVVYTATDTAGNSSEEIIYITVRDNAEKKEFVDKKVDYIVSSILKNKKTDLDKLHAIWRYVYNNIEYVGNAKDRDIYGAAYDAIKKRQGDCYYYFALSKLLLEKAGFETVDMERIDGTHYWNLVKYNGEWYHFDACWHDKDYHEFRTFMLTEKEAVAYGKWVRREDYYEYDHTGIPETAEESLNWNKKKLPTLED